MDYNVAQRQLRQALGVAYWRSLEARGREARPESRSRLPPDDEVYEYDVPVGRIEEVGM